MLESPNPESPTAPAGNPVLAMQLLRDYFQAQADRGKQRVALTPASRVALRSIVSTKFGAPTPPAPNALRETEPTYVPAKPAPTAPAAAPVPAPRVRPTALSKADRVAKLAELRQAAENHAPAKSLGTLRDIMVFAVGDPMARLMFVGEAPGAEEEQKREPFVGPAGQTLTKMIKAMGIERDQVYISNICKFRPKIADQGTSNRKPDPGEMAACIEFVRQEIEIVQPEVIIALGATAAEGLLGLSNVAVGRVRARFHDYQGIPVMITYHPSYLLHNNAMSERRKVWEDLMKVMERVGLPINEKQRGFFLPKA